MNFELLANETILDLFEYFSISDLFHAFFDLNSRFHQLLCIQFQKFHLDLCLVSKTEFQHIFQNYVPLIISRIISLRLSNDDASQEIELFLSQHYRLRQFIRLQSISLSVLRSQQMLDQIMIECSYLSRLTHLTFFYGYIPTSNNDTKRFFNQIWSLKNLTHCHFNISFNYKYYFPNPTIISTSLRHLVIYHSSCSVSTLTHLCQHTPNLEYLSDIFIDHSNAIELPLPTLSINRLKIRFSSSLDILEHLLRNMPDLHHLTCETTTIYINGYQWETMIRNYLSKLSIFQVKMSFFLLNDKDVDVRLNDIVDTYRTKFWIDEHQWFVRCHRYTSDAYYESSRINLYTLPYTFDSFSEDTDCILTKSTSPYDDKYLTCDRVINLCYYSPKFTSPPLSDVRFNHLQHLSLVFPLDDQFFSIVCRLDQLTSLDVSVNRDKNLDNIQSQLQFLLDQTPSLRSLIFGVWFSSNFQVPPIEMTSVSVRQLDLQGLTYDNKQRCYDDNDCDHLCMSPLGKQCQTLLINVKNRRNILDLVNNMPNLQALHVVCEDDSLTDESNLVPPKKDELIEWLRQQLPATCMIARDEGLIYYIRLWIR